MGCCQSPSASRPTDITVAPATDAPAPVLLTEVPAEEAKETEEVNQEVHNRAEELKEEVQKEAEELKQEVQEVAEAKQEVQEAVEELKQEAQHEVDEFKKEVAADVAAGRKALSWLKERFESLAADEAGAVSKEELVTKLRETDEVDGQSFGELVGLAGFNPSWQAFEQLDTSMDGHVSWEELKAHLCGEKEVDEEVDALVDTTMVTQKCWGCC